MYRGGAMPLEEEAQSCKGGWNASCALSKEARAVNIFFFPRKACPVGERVASLGLTS